MENDLDKITKNGRALFLAYDHGMEHGPADFDDQSVDPEKILEIADSGYFTAVILQKGIAEKYYQKDKNKVPLIVKLNGKTNLLTDEDPYSPQICSVEEAISLGASAVGYTVYVGSKYEAKMISEFSKIEKETDKVGLPLIGWMYPRGKAVEGRERSKEILAYGARIALEIGAEMIKIPYSGDLESFRWVVQSAGKTKVVVMGGQKTSEEEFFKMVSDVLKAGAVGFAVGRNVWQSRDPLEMSKRLAEIIWKAPAEIKK
ncbi:MAG: class I fructose-bisphosphate aldolase [Patescibacteria group bacterium]